MKDKLFAVLYFFGIAAFLRRKKCHSPKKLPDTQSVTILSLHRISDDKDPCWQPISPRLFEQLLQYVGKNYRVIRFSDIAEQLKSNTENAKPLLILTFDDGYRDFMQYALPLLQKYQLPCNHNFVIDCLQDNALIWTQRLNAIFNHLQPSNKKISLSPIAPNTLPISIDFSRPDWYAQYIHIFKNMLVMPHNQRIEQIKIWEFEQQTSPYLPNMMNWDDLKDCHRSGLVEIGSHTYTHDVMSTLAENPEALRRELQDSKQLLEQQLGIPISILALPNGQNHQHVTDAAQAAGYQILLETGDKLNWISPNSSNFTIFQRINLIQEPAPSMFLRAELLHERLRPTQ